MTNDQTAKFGDERFAGLAFPVVKVRYAGPTNTLGGRYIASVRDVRVTHSYDHAISSSDNALRAARKAWSKYQTSKMVNINDDPRVFIPGDLSDDSYVYLVVPSAFLA
jgi:hypothetical protein